MAFEELKAEMTILMDPMNSPAPDTHEAYERIKQTLETMKAEGLPLPDDLVELERKLESLFRRQ